TKTMKYLLFNALVPEQLPTLKELTTTEICKVWASASRYIRRQLLQKKVVEIGIGTFAVIQTCATLEQGKDLTVERPVFQPCRFLKTFYQLKCEETKILEEAPSIPLDFEQIAADIHFRQEIVEQCIHETLLFFAGTLRDNKEVEFSFK
ncbi:CCD81 protein, partial [Steatornis caripensis]|nr:CCD81 protein [Steatornis caripensis]